MQQITKNIVMLTYHWHDLMINATVIADKVIIQALPANITNLHIQSRDVERIQKTFKGQITINSLNIVLNKAKNTFTNIRQFYQYLCKCFNQQQNVGFHSQNQSFKNNKITISRQWHNQQKPSALSLQRQIIIKKYKIERLVLRIVMPSNQQQQDRQIKIEEKQIIQYVAELKEDYLQINSLLLKVNLFILNQRDYFRLKLQDNNEKMQQMYYKFKQKMKKQIKQMKQQFNEIIKNCFEKHKKLNEETSRQIRFIKESKEFKISSLENKQMNKKKIKSRSQIKERNDDKSEIKIQQKIINKGINKQQGSLFSQKIINIQKKQKKKMKNNSKNKKVQMSQSRYLQKLKNQDSSLIKHEEDQQSRRLKSFEQLNSSENIVAIPLQFDTQNPAYHFFTVSNKSVTKIGGFDYPKMMLKYIIPKQDTHGVIIKYFYQKKIGRLCCLEIGIIDESIKRMLHSSIVDNYIKLKINVSTVFTKVRSIETKRKFTKLRVLKVGQWIELRINLKLGIISWIFSYGLSVTVQIPVELRGMNLQPFVGMFTTNDIIQFQAIQNNI